MSETQGVRYSQARTFLKSFSTEDAAKLPIDPDSTLESSQKIELLFTLLQTQLAKKETDSKPEPLFDADYAVWEKLHTAIFCVQKDLGNNIQAEMTLHMLIERRRDKTNLSLLLTLCGMLIERGEYEEVAKKLPEIIEWLDRRLGENSPQALGGRRMLAETVWHLGRKAEAEALFSEIKKLAESMAEGPYAPLPRRRSGSSTEVEPKA
ncbi:hypothetical protein F4801DRAFT_580375 [Xylaria longipes]|nr:hypothetical protein F4801DRAFT_580375 [Xylaria longipes]